MRKEEPDTASKMPTYISLFSSAGVGCYGFKQNGFRCIATNELIERRLDVQRNNQKCKYDSGYIAGDITLPETKKKILDEVAFWRRKEGIRDVDVLVATPPCQGISVANHKKNNELGRNSLVIESINILKSMRPKFFVFENVAAFLKTTCTDLDGKEKPIRDAIFVNLGKQYSIYHRVINLKNYGSNSSRTRTLVIGVRNDLANDISPIELFPSYQKEKTLRQVIGDQKKLETMGEIDQNDFYHAFRSYPEHMREWISDISEGQSAFDNKDENKVPYKVVDGKRVTNQNKNGDKYKRQFWDKVAPCVHTRNDLLASQNTVHPEDDRVFSVRELMRIMTIPDDFKWNNLSLEELNRLSDAEKRLIYKKDEMNIRQSIGEAVPTELFATIARNIIETTAKTYLTLSEIKNYIERRGLKDENPLFQLIKDNPDNLGVSTLAKISELANPSREKNAAFFTDKTIVTAIINELPDLDSQNARILEPSVGVGNFIELLAKNYQYVHDLTIDAIDIDSYAIRVLGELLKKTNLQMSVKINIVEGDSLLHNFKYRYDLVIGNPPFGKVPSKEKLLLKKYRGQAANKDTSNIFAFFVEKALTLGDKTALITPKAILNAPEFRKTRELLENKSILSVIDFGEKGFSKVLIETVAIITADRPVRNNEVTVVSVPLGTIERKKQSYVTDRSFPYWLIYRNSTFDEISTDFQFDIFHVFRDRQISNRHLSEHGKIRVLRSRNISDSGKEIVDIDGYDKYINPDQESDKFAIFRLVDDDTVYLSPNMTYKPRVMRKPKGIVANGSVAILIPKSSDLVLTDDDLSFFSTEEYRSFYSIARNHQTRSLNIDACSVFFFGKKRVRMV